MHQFLEHDIRDAFFPYYECNCQPSFYINDDQLVLPYPNPKLKFLKNETKVSNLTWNGHKIRILKFLSTNSNEAQLIFRPVLGIRQNLNIDSEKCSQLNTTDMKTC